MNAKTHPESDTDRRGILGARAVRLGQIVGITVALDVSLLIIFALIVLTLAIGVLPHWHPDWGMGAIVVTAVSAALLFLVSILAHELAHAIVGRRLGVRVERITLFVFGGMAHMENEPRTWQAELGMALAGPATSLILGLLFLNLAGLISGPIEVDPDDPIQAISKLSPVATALFWLGPVNILLGLFNMVPGFPHDGGRVLRAILWGMSGDFRRATRWAASCGQAFAWLLIGIGFAMILGVRVPFFGAGPVAGLWIALIGWFLNGAAVSSYQRVVVQETLGDVRVTRVMHSDYVEVAPSMTVRAFVDELLLRSSQRAFPVVEEGELRGLVCLEDVRKLDPERRGITRVSDIMTPVERLHTVSPSEKTTDALNLLAEHKVNQLPVVDEGRLLGLVTREGILKWLSLRQIPSHGGPGR